LEGSQVRKFITQPARLQTARREMSKEWAVIGLAGPIR
jgi:hypothetical protein